MALQWSSTAANPTATSVKILTYGDSGVGKTVLCATAPRPVLISAESGTLSLSRANIEKLYGVNSPTVCYDLPVLKVTDMASLMEAYRWVSGSKEAAQFATVCVDSLSEIGEVVLAAAKKQFKDPRQAYGELIEQMHQVIRAFRDLPGHHVYMSAKVEPQKDDYTGVVRYWPSLPGSKLGPQLAYFFDEVFRLATAKDAQGKKYRFFHTDCDMPYIAKDRSGALDEYEKPDLSYIISKIQGVHA